MNPGCEFYKNGRCKKYPHVCKCTPGSREWLDMPMEVIEPEQICSKRSIFGNYYLGITEEQLDAIRKGLVLFKLDEYGMFVGLKPTKTD